MRKPPPSARTWLHQAPQSTRDMARHRPQITHANAVHAVGFTLLRPQDCWLARLACVTPHPLVTLITVAAAMGAAVRVGLSMW